MVIVGIGNLLEPIPLGVVQLETGYQLVLSHNSKKKKKEKRLEQILYPPKRICQDIHGL